jgi:uncharacterized membrane protein
MLPEPLHPAVVHLPLALAVLVPLFALLAALAIRAGLTAPRTWAAVVLLQALLVGSAWLALETGEEEEERVEEVVPERHIESHEERAERFLLGAAAALVVIGAGVLPGGAGGVARAAAVLASAAVLALGIQVGHSGGELVYRHGAASAYASKRGEAGSAAARAVQEEVPEPRRDH